MSEDIKVDLELDLKGLLCPLPMVKVSQNIKNIPVDGNQSNCNGPGKPC
ncbi:MAG: hypothetical protein M1365_13750 [Actinobacteria bacterium]|nr:hypothetical protein [Actinomycetota bacterium]